MDTEVVDPVVAPPVFTRVVPKVNRRLGDVFAEQRERWTAIHPSMCEAFDTLGRFVSDGGKRLRPALCVLGFEAASGTPADSRAVDAAAALELLHAFALVHDDVMDGSCVRRGEPTLHMQWRGRHRRADWRGDERRFGEGIAILLGDLAFVLADTVLGDVPAAARRVYDELRLELHVGQYLDMVGAARGATDAELARTVAVFKSGKYTVERPLHLGAALAGRLDDLAAPFTAYGLPLGEAFQLRDDLLGAFGDADIVGKPVGDDFREGKMTPLVIEAMERSAAGDRYADLAVLSTIGNVDLDEPAVDAIREVLDDCGARSAIERRIDTLVDQACAAIEGAAIDMSARGELMHLAGYLAYRKL